MSQPIDTAAILLAIKELSDQVKSSEQRMMTKIDQVEEKLSKRIDTVEARLTNVEDKIDQVDTKFTVLVEDVLEIRADVLKLKRAK